MKKKKSISLKWGLFEGPVRGWFKDLWIYIKRIVFSIKHAYPPFALWETYEWFRVSMIEILTHYRNNRTGTPVLIETGESTRLTEEEEAENNRLYNNKIDKMIDLLYMMEDQYDYENYEKSHEKMNQAKDEFFKEFSELFYSLWD